MSEKFTLKVIQHGQTQQVKVLRPAAGISGQAVVVKATNGARFQLADLVTLVAPQKVQLKRVDGNLHLALPGGDIDAPDLVIQDYFNVKGATLQGASISGEMLSYDTSSLASTSVGVFDKFQTALTGETSDVSQHVKSEAVTLGESASVFGNPWVWAGLVGVGAAAGGGGGGGGGGSQISSLTGLNALKAYATSTGAKTAPTLANYKEADIKALGSLAETDTDASLDIDSPSVISAVGATWLQALNSALGKQTVSNLDKTTLQKMVASYYRILSEADGVVNTTSNVDVYPVGSSATSDDPLASDYVNIGATVGNTLKSLALLNDFVGLSKQTSVDTVEKIDTVAKAAENVMLKAKGATTSASGGPAIYATDAEWVTGLTALGLTGINSRNITAVKKAIDDSTNDATGDGSAIDTVQEIKDIIKVAVALQALKDYANATKGAGVTSPTLSTYKDADLKALANLSEVTASADVDASTVTNSMGGAANWLLALNSALDKQVGNDALTPAKLQTLVDSYYRILSEADGVVNTTANVDVYPNTADAAAGASLAGNNDPSKADYTNIGTTVGNDKSIDLLNDYVGAANKSAVDTVDEINTVAKAAYNVMLLAGVAAGTGNVPAAYSVSDNNTEWIAGLNTLLGLTTSNGVNTSNIAAVKKALEDTKGLNTANDGVEVDTVQEIKDIIKSAIALQILKDFTNDSAVIGAKIATTPTLSTYTDLGIKTFKSLEDVSDANRKDFGDKSTGGGAISNEFITAGILNAALDKLDGNKLDKAKVQAMVDAYYRILQEADGDSAINKDVYADTTNDLTNANAYSDPIQADYEALGVTVADAIGGGATLGLLNDAIGRLGNAAVDTAEKIQTLATTANDVLAMAKQTAGATPAPSQSDAKLVDGLNALLGITTITGVNTNNIGAIKTEIVKGADNGTDVNTVEKLLGILGLVRLQSFTEDSGTYYVSSAGNTKSTPAPTLNDWSSVGTGIKANTSLSDGADVAINQATYWKTTNPTNGLQALNSALDTYDKTNVNQSTLQNIVDSYGRILQSADGARTTQVDVSNVSNTMNGATVTEQDLINIGVTSGGANGSGTGIYYLKTGDLLASSIGSLLSTAVDTVQELNTLEGYAESIMKYAAGGSAGYSDDQWLAAFVGLRVGGVTVNNLSDIRTAIGATANDGTGVDTWDELQSIVSLVRLNNYATGTDISQTPYLIDYQSLAYVNGKTDAYTAVQSTYLSSLNSVIKAKKVATSAMSEVGNMVNAYTKLLDMADGVANVDNTTSLASGDTDSYGGSFNNSNNLTVDDFNAIFKGAVTYKITDLTNSITGSGTVKAKTIADTFSDIVDQLSPTNVDTVAKLSEIGQVLNKLFLMASDGSASNSATLAPQQQGLTKADLGLLGLKVGGNSLATDANVTDAEFKGFCDYIILSPVNNGAAINSFTELQTLLNQAVMNY